MKFKENVKTIFQYETKKNELKYNLNKKILIKIVIFQILIKGKLKQIL